MSARSHKWRLKCPQGGFLLDQVKWSGQTMGSAAAVWSRDGGLAQNGIAARKSIVRRARTTLWLETCCRARDTRGVGLTLYLILNDEDRVWRGRDTTTAAAEPTAEHALQSALGACLWQRQQEPLRFNAGQGSGETPPPGLAGEPFGCSPARSSVPRRRRACRLCGHIPVLSSRMQLS